MNYFRLVRVFFRVNIVGELAYRINFFINLFQSILGLGTALLGMAIIFSFTSSLGGWSPAEILALVGIYVLIGGIIRFTIQPGMEQLIESVRDGTFDFTLTKPEDAQLMTSISRFGIWEIINIFLGFALLLVALARLGGNVGGLAALAFWLVRVENILTIFQSMYEAGRWPISLYPAWLRYGLTFVIPVAFATTVPVEALTNRLNWETLLVAFGLAVILLMASRAFWKMGLRHYSGTSA